MLEEQALKSILAQQEFSTESFRLLFSVDSEQIYGLEVRGKVAIAQWHLLHKIKGETGYYPVLIGNNAEEHRYSVEEYDDYSEDNSPTTISEIIEHGCHLDLNIWFITRAKEMLSWSLEGDDIDNIDPLSKLISDSLGVWPNHVTPQPSFTIPWDWQNQRHFEHLTMALIPTKDSWKTPAFLKFGRWNDCPAPEIHVALMKHWHNLYGAEIVGIKHDIIEVYVTRPPLDRKSALDLAKEQYLYCYDIVAQGVQTISALAAVILKGSSWYFWWD